MTKSYWPERTVHAVDIENLAGEGHRHPDALSFATAAYKRLVPRGPFDQCWVGSDVTPAHRFQVATVWPGVRWVCGRGHDGADRALLEALDPDWLAGRFAGITIGSGDGIFSDLADQMRERGLLVTVVSRRSALSRQLARAAHIVRLLPPPPPTVDAVTDGPTPMVS